MNIGEATKLRILQLCEQKNITVNRLASVCGITQSTLSNIVNGRNSTTVTTIKKICDGLEITMKEFFDSDIFDSLKQEIV